MNGLIYARKLFRPQNQRKRVFASFQKEMGTIRKFSNHRHIITYIGSYVAGSELGILLLPIADQNLHEPLHSLDSGEQRLDENGDILMKCFDCLTSGLAFMHNEHICHQDIKPANILIHVTNVLFTDFGLAFNFDALDNSAKTRDPGAMTKKYSAREVHEASRRDTRAEIFSLGCVFLEICTALAGLSLEKLGNSLVGDSEDDSYWEEGI